uniref:Coiled-coil domain-containing protein 89 n=1 Tax=Leptobrachium leishanense TaxID=445787 RepID=A0A8C5MES8_9ANUR
MPGDTSQGHSEEPNGEFSSLQKVSSSLPWDMKTENAMLRSRLEEQSQLICLLKQRADETFHRCQGLDRINTELERRNTELSDQCETEKKRGDQLDERFGVLADNHQQMILFKDEYKKQNDELRRECEKLQEHTHPELLERERSIQELRIQLQTMEMAQRDQIVRHGKEVEELESRLEKLMEKNQGRSQELESLKQKLTKSQDLSSQAQQEVTRLTDAHSTSQREAEKHMAELRKEKEDLIQLCMERGRNIQEKQSELAELRVKMQEAEKARQGAEERFLRDSVAVDADARVADIRRRLEESEKELGQLRREFEAYKIHSGSLLSKERELNAKLRHLIG